MTAENRLFAIAAAMMNLYKSNPESKIAQQFVKAYMNQDVKMIAEIAAKFEAEIGHLSEEDQEHVLMYHWNKSQGKI